jgi:cysteine synthase B
MASIIDLVGNTPLVEITKLNPNPNVTMYAKLEGDNPGGSVKDRPALNMIRSALERGEINQGTKLIEATSGNTGIALAMIARLYDLEIELVMPSTSTRDRSTAVSRRKAASISSRCVWCRRFPSS